jgi:glycosyltransferase involved in cell wall biosynthesis
MRIDLAASDQKPVVLFVLPSVRISGGVWEAFRLASDLRKYGIDAQIVSMWHDSREVEGMDFPYREVPISYLSDLKPRKTLALLQLPYLALSFLLYSQRIFRGSEGRQCSVVLTHYSTCIFAPLVPKPRRFCFVQDLEWRFVRSTVLRKLLRHFLQFVYAQSAVFTTNSWVTEQMSSSGIEPIAETSIWASADFCAQPAEKKSINVLMLVRKNYFKRLDLYVEVCKKLREISNLTCAVVAPDDSTVVELKDIVDECIIRPNRQELRAIYQRSQVFLLLSDAEGFGLPPLEAMGSGCVPVCRDSGGVRCYMTHGLEENLIPLTADADEVVKRIKHVLASPDLDRLSREARTTFLDGLTRTVNCRVGAIEELAGIFSKTGRE